MIDWNNIFENEIKGEYIMKSQMKHLVMLFTICLFCIPTLTFATDTNQTVGRIDQDKGNLKCIKVVPKEVKLLRGTSEEEFRKLIIVEAYYKGEEEPQVVTNYTTNYSEIKDEQGLHTVEVVYKDKGCTKKAKVCVKICKEISYEEEQVERFPYVSGYEDGTFRADQPVTREELAAMIGRLTSKNNIPDLPNIYNDLNPSRYSTPAINYLTQLGVFAPDVQGNFKPQDAVSEVEFRQILNKIRSYADLKAGQDIPLSNLITRAEAVTVLNKIFKRDCENLSFMNPYSDLTLSHPAYNEILCASVQMPKEPR